MREKPALIHFNFLAATTLQHRTRLKIFLLQLFKAENTPVEQLTYIFCTDEYLIQLNKNYLHHDTYTDIITFQLSSTGMPILGDIYISIERIRENAATFMTTLTHELHRVIFHGALHLCGYNDKTVKDKILMQYKEDFYLSHYFVPRKTVSDRNL